MKITHILFIAGALTLSLLPVRAATPEPEPDALEMSIDDNLATPAVPNKARNYVRTAMDQLRRSLLKQGFDVVADRDGEVLEICVPCDRLFAANSTDLKTSGQQLLRPLGTLASDTRKYKIVIAVHADDTGDDQYADSITSARANAVDDYLWQLARRRDTNTIPYGLGRDEPRVPNNSRHNREQNRRVEIYIVPDRGLLELAGVRRKQ